MLLILKIYKLKLLVPPPNAMYSHDISRGEALKSLRRNLVRTDGRLFATRKSSGKTFGC